MITIDELNRLELEAFAHALRPLFEAAAPLADALFLHRPFTSYAALIDTAEAFVLAMRLADQLEVLSAHPRIGAPPETMSAASRTEQGYGTDPAPPATSVDAQLAELNALYERRFGFRFVVFVNRRPRSEILEVLKQRLEQSPDQELRTGLHDMFLIARDRLASAS